MAAARAEHREVEVVLDAQAEEQAGLLVGAAHAEPGAARRADTRSTSCPRNSIVPEVGRHVPRDHVEQRGLAGAVGAEDGAALAVRDVEVDVAHGVEAAEAPADPPQAEDRRGGSRWLLSCMWVATRRP